MTNPLMNIYGSIDIQYDCILDDVVNVLLTTDIQGVAPFNTEASGYLSLSFGLGSKTVDGITYVTGFTKLNGVIIDQASYPLSASYSYPVEHIRFFADGTNLSIYVGGKCVYSFVLGFVNYVNDPVTLSLSIHGSTMTLNNIKRTELHDYRDAVYIDYEATADSALQSVIQERPVQIFAEPDRSLTFTYHCIKGILDAHHVKQYSPTITPNNNLSSDGLIYFTNVGINASEDTAKEVGFVTRLYRLSNLENGAIQATKILQRLALERRYPMQLISQRFDPRLVIADEIVLDKRVTGTNTELIDLCIIEDVQMSIQDGNSSMTLNGRRLKNAQ